MFAADLFSLLNEAIAGAPLLAVAAAFTWGVLSLVLSPCHLTSIPLIVGFISGQGSGVSTRRAFTLSLVFTLGILITIALIGLVTAAFGQMIGYVGAWVNYFVAAVFFAVGLHLLGVLPVPWQGVGAVRMRGKGIAAAFMLGLVFGLALGPCTFAFMAPVLGASLKAAASNVVFAVVLLVTYGLGHGAMIVVAGTSTDLVQRLVRWNEDSAASAIARSVCGVLVIAGGLYLIYAAP